LGTTFEHHDVAIRTKRGHEKKRLNYRA